MGGVENVFFLKRKIVQENFSPLNNVSRYIHKYISLGKVGREGQINSFELRAKFREISACLDRK